MIIAKFKYEGETTTAKLPGSWDEMKVKHYLALETTKNPLELMALLSDVDLSKVINTRTDLTPVLGKLVELLNSEMPDFRKHPRRTFSIAGKTVKIPTDFNGITFGQSAMIETHLAATGGDERKAILKIMGVILQPLLDKGPFNLARAEHYERLAGNLPIKTVFPNVFFFWTVLKDYIIIGAVNLKASL